MKKLLFIVNPRAGRTRSMAPMFDVVARLSQAGYLIKLFTTEGPGDAKRAAAELGGDFDMVVCAGGDGTLNEAVSGLMQDLGQHNGRYFAYVASFGAFTRASYSATQAAKNALGHLAYIFEGMNDLDSLRPYCCRIEAGGEVFEVEYIFGAICNSTSLGGLMKLDPNHVQMDDGKFELLLLRMPKNAVELSTLIGSLTRMEYNAPGIIFRHVAHVILTTDDIIPWSLDGEYAASQPRVEIRNLHHAIELMV